MIEFPLTDYAPSKFPTTRESKAHLIAPDKNGDAFSFGMSNKGQCGMEIPSKKESEGASAAAANAALSTGATVAADSKPLLTPKSAALGAIDGSKRIKGTYCCIVGCHRESHRDRFEAAFFRFPSNVRYPEKRKL